MLLLLNYSSCPHRVQRCVVLCVTVLNWFSLYLSEMMWPQHSSAPISLHLVVPQGSVLGPLLLRLYIVRLFDCWGHERHFSVCRSQRVMCFCITVIHHDLSVCLLSVFVWYSSCCRSGSGTTVLMEIRSNFLFFLWRCPDLNLILCLSTVTVCSVTCTVVLCHRRYFVDGSVWKCLLSCRF